MPQLIKTPTVIAAPGNKPKEIREYIGRVNSNTDEVSVAHMKSPPGWIEPGQTPAFNEYTIVLKGMLRVKTKGDVIDVNAGEAIITLAGEWVQYSTPQTEGAEYIAVCCPGFSPEAVHRDDE
jgi:quercetin dioxygenase-like cupin family protein